MKKSPKDRKYAPTHEWVLPADAGFQIGISDHAQNALGDVVFLQLPEVGKKVAAGDACATVESVKAASDIYAPVAGTIVAVNNDALTHPEKINADAFGTWLFVLQADRPADTEKLLSAEEYEKTLHAE